VPKSPLFLLLCPYVVASSCPVEESSLFLPSHHLLERKHALLDIRQFLTSGLFSHGPHIPTWFNPNLETSKSRGIPQQNTLLKE